MHRSEAYSMGAYGLRTCEKVCSKSWSSDYVVLFLRVLIRAHTVTVCALINTRGCSQIYPA